MTTHTTSWLQITQRTALIFALGFSGATLVMAVLFVATPYAHAERAGFGLVLAAAAASMWVVHWLLRKTACAAETAHTTRR